ncbi:hypothetical protein S83_043678 [Arachis hypogaea]
MIDRLSSGYAVANNCVFWVNSEGRLRKKPVSMVQYATVESAWDEIEINATACVDHPTLISHHDHVDFVTYEQSALRFGVHVMTINLGPVGTMEWGWHLFIGDPNLTETPSVKFGRDLLRISHSICDFDTVQLSLDAVISEAQFHSIGLTDGVARFIGRVTRPGVVCIKGCMGFSLEV